MSSFKLQSAKNNVGERYFLTLPKKTIEKRLLNPNIVQSTDAICNKIENIKEYNTLSDIHPYISKFRLE